MTSNVRHEPDDLLTRETLVDFFTGALRPDPSSHLIGTELEKFGIVSAEAPEGQPGALRPVSYHEHILPVLQAMISEHGWTPGSDRGTRGEIVELVRDGASITLEPGGQLELSGKPLPNVHATCAEFTEHYRELHSVSEPLGLSWMAAGFHPWATRDEINWMPKGRYAVMRAYLPTKGRRALDMMLRTCTVQANFDYASEAQCGIRLRTAAGVAPIVAAMFANSPFVEGRRTGLQSSRNQVWTDVDPDRCGTPEFFFDEVFSFEKYVDWVLDVPMFFIKREGEYHPYHVPFRQFLEEGWVSPEGERYRARWRDWVVHLSTVFPEVRLKPHIEFRSADAIGSRYVCALPALLKGLLYDDDALEEAWSLVSDLDEAGRHQLRVDAMERGVHEPKIATMALALVRTARRALDRVNIRDGKGRTEARFLDPLERLVERGRSPGDESSETLGDHPGRDPEARHALVRAFHFAGVFG